MTRLASLLLLALAPAAFAAELHVSVQGNDGNDGDAARPFKTISAAAAVGQPGDVVTVHEGTYRERITPPRGGASDARRIVYQAAGGEKAVIKGSEVVKGWEPVDRGVWKITLLNSFFGDYNPYKDLIVGDWFRDEGRPHHTGGVYLNGKSFYEMSKLEEVLDPKPVAASRFPDASLYTWFCESDDKTTTIHANFHGADPNAELVEINVRDACFYPDEPGRNYITVRGFEMRHAATQWAAPTAEQIGLIGTHWSKGWIIEDNVISDSRCSGITLGKDRATGHNLWTNDPSKSGTDHYNDVIVRALEIGWSKENIGSHIVRNNTISNCEQTGICGSLGGVFSQITGNHIHDIWTKRLFSGAEIAGIKIHGAIDMQIIDNRIHNAGRGIWMDWMAQGTRVSRNLLYDNTTDDIYFEVDHGPYVVDNNILLSPLNLFDLSEGGAYVHNLFAGRIHAGPEPTRQTPHHKPHSTEVIELRDIKGGDNRFYNNIFIGVGPDEPRHTNPRGRFTALGTWVYDDAALPLFTGGNVYLNGAKPYKGESDAVVLEHDPSLELDAEGDSWLLSFELPKLDAVRRTPVNSARLGTAVIPGLPFERPDGSPLIIETDFFGNPIDASNPAPGPFGKLQPGRNEFDL